MPLLVKVSDLPRQTRSGGAYQLKVEPHGDIVKVLSELTELTERLEMLDFHEQKKEALCYVL
ncbi:hypothetical protein KKC44_04615 [Patescibacteria group bacterium]|nr:hypothetical protein [Patescibacteria group bacterium]MBU2259860.1 hypothetical protein [Patescibacteria group bacterium]